MIFIQIYQEKYKLKYCIEFINSYETIQEAYNKEQYILALFNNYRITTNYNGFYTSETFNKNVLEKYYEVI